MNKEKQTPRFNLLIDTCVWLDVAKDYQQQAVLAALEELIQQTLHSSFRVPSSMNLPAIKHALSRTAVAVCPAR